jgi:hypothetical protein
MTGTGQSQVRRAKDEGEEEWVGEEDGIVEGETSMGTAEAAAAGTEASGSWSAGEVLEAPAATEALPRFFPAIFVMLCVLICFK